MIIVALATSVGVVGKEREIVGRVPCRVFERAAFCEKVSQVLGRTPEEAGSSVVTSIRLTCAIEVSCPVGSKTLVLRFEQIIRKLKELGVGHQEAGQLTETCCAVVWKG